MNENTEICPRCGEAAFLIGPVCQPCMNAFVQECSNLETVEFEGTFISTRPNVLGRTFLYALPRGRFLEVVHEHGQAGEIDLKTYESLTEYLSSSPSADAHAAALRVQMMPETSVVQ